MIDRSFTKIIRQELFSLVSLIFSYFKNLPMLVYNDKALFFLTIIFTFLYLPQAFILNENIGLILGYETDPGSIIKAMERVLDTYNMHSAYHSKFYGWIYFSINFFLLKPIDLFLSVFSIEDRSLLYLSIRLVFFSIGLLSLILFYQLCRIFFSPLLSFLGGLTYALINTNCLFFYFIHPETTGIIFVILATIALIKFIENMDTKYFFYGIICLSLAVLSKQIFFFISFPFLLSFLYFYCSKNKINVFKFLISRVFFRAMAISFAIAFFLLLMIHPFGIIEFDVLIKTQRSLSVFTEGDLARPLFESYTKWITLLFNIPITSFLMMSWPFALVISLIIAVKKSSDLAMLFFINLLGIAFIMILIATNNRLYFAPQYLQPLSPFIIISVLAISNFLMQKDLFNRPYLTIAIKIFMTYFFVLSLAYSAYAGGPNLLKRFDYKYSIAYLTYQYLDKEINIVSGDKIAHGQSVAIPSRLSKQSCHFWNGCGTDNIESVNPNYVIFDPEWKINDIRPSEARRLEQYVRDHKMELINTIQGNDKKVLVYKK